MRMPSHLRKFSQGYALEDWVDKDCPLADYFELLHPLAGRLDLRAFRDVSAAEKILVNLAANILDEDGLLEDYVLGVQPLNFHDLSQPGAMAPVCEAAGIFVVRRYRTGIKNGTWVPAAAERGSQ